MGAMTEPTSSSVTEADELDGHLFDTPIITVDANFQIGVEWPNEEPPPYVQMDTALFTEWIGMINALRRLIDLQENVRALERTTHADGSPGRPPGKMLDEIDRLKAMLRIP